MASEYSTDDYMVLLATPTLRDRQLKVKQIEKYVRLQWIVFGSLMGFFTILNVTRSLLTYYRVRRKSTVTAVATTASGGDAEKASATPPPAGSSNKMALRRLPAAVSSGFRIVAFRWTVWYGPGSVLNLSELALIWIYVGLNLMWTFIDS
jgi:ferric-chelate reductase